MPYPFALPALANMLETGSEEITGLDRLLYASDDEIWDGESFYDAFEQGMAFKTPAKKSREVLKPLYPE